MLILEGLFNIFLRNKNTNPAWIHKQTFLVFKDQVTRALQANPPHH